MKKFFIFSTFLLLPFYINSIELTTQDVSVFRVGVVDMDKILSEYTKSKEFQRQIQLFKENKKAELVNYEKEIEDLIKKKLEIFTEIEQLKQQITQYTQYNEIVVSSENLSSGDISATTSSEVAKNVTEKNQEIQQIKKNIDSKQKNIDEIEKSISEKREILKQKQKEIDNEVEEMKQKYEIELFADLYDIIKKIADQEGLNVVIDKSSILYGELKIDITEKVLKMLK